MNPYKVLGINENSDEKEIKKAFRILAKKHHPDICKTSNSEATFIIILEAYEILKLGNWKWQKNLTKSINIKDVYDTFKKENPHYFNYYGESISNSQALWDHNRNLP